LSPMRDLLSTMSLVKESYQSLGSILIGIMGD
jgi:hypothetical protein